MFFSRNTNVFSLDNASFPTRRTVLKGLALFAVGSLSPLSRLAYAAPENQRILTVYFSHTGNTRTVARQIHAAVGGDILELQTVQTYPADHDSTVRQAEKEEENNFRPQLSTQFPEGMNDYDIIFVGYPVWVYTMPMALYSFFDQFKFPGKTIVPFSTHLGSGLAGGPKQIARLCPQATVSKGLAIRGNRVASSQDTVNDWLHGLGITKQ